LSTLLSPRSWHTLQAGIILIGTTMTLWLTHRVRGVKQQSGSPRYVSLPFVGLALACTVIFFLILHPEILLRV
jgi:hypothetical protein